MKKEVSIILLCFIFFCSCYKRDKSFDRQNIVDKTEEYVESRTSWVAIKKNESVDGYTRIGNSIYGGEISCNVEPLKDIDLNTFKVLPGTKYGKDKNYVYYPLSVTCIDYIDCGVCYYTRIVVEKANPESFRYINKEYATDGENVYFRGELIADADGKTFKVIDGPEFFYFAVDVNKVYMHENIFEEADPLTFTYDSENENNLVKGQHRYIIKDKNTVWEYIPPNSINKIESK